MADASDGPRPYAVTETLYQDERKTVYRALRAGTDPRPVILKVFDPRRCRERDLERLRHEYEIGAPLDLQTIVRPLAIESYQGMPALVLEDCGGEPLDRLLGAPMPLERFLVLASRIAGNNLFCLHLCHAVNISLRHGNAPSATYAYGWFGVILIAVFHRAAEGYRFAKLGYDLVERHRLLAHKAALGHMKIAAFWTRPMDEEFAFARASFEAGVEAGDLVAACFGCAKTVLGMLARGDPLPEVELEVERGLDFARKAGFDDIRDLITGFELFVSAMRGRSRHLSAFDDARSGEADLESRLDRERQPSLVFFVLVVKLMARFLSGDLEAALKVKLIDGILEPRPIAPTATFAVRAEQLDLLSVVKAPQTIRTRRTREPVILDNASAGSDGFTADPYFTRSSTRSVLCLPIVRQDLAGLLSGPGAGPQASS